MGVMLLSEVRRLLRSPAFLIFTVGFPVAFLVIMSGIYSTGTDDREALILLTLNMAAFGAITRASSGPNV